MKGYQHFGKEMELMLLKKLHFQQSNSSFMKDTNKFDFLTLSSSFGSHFFLFFFSQFLTPKDQQLPSPFIRFVSGGLAAATAVFTTYPLDVVQTQLTVQTKQNKYKGITGTLRTIYHEEGFAQLYRGLLMGFLVCFYLDSFLVLFSLTVYF